MIVYCVWYNNNNDDVPILRHIFFTKELALQMVLIAQSYAPHLNHFATAMDIKDAIPQEWQSDEM